MLNGVHIDDNTGTAQWDQPSPERSAGKRPAQAAFGSDKDRNAHQHDGFSNVSDPQQTPSNLHMDNQNGVQDLSTRIMAHMLGLEMPGVEPSTSFFPGYEWWPRTSQGYPQPPPQAPIQSPTFSGHGLDRDLLGNVAEPSTMVTQDLDWMQAVTPVPQGQPPVISNLNLNYPYDFQQYGGP